jgi:FtsP/CotA-like multicopper oxidase with cupredoxin domain
VNPPVSLAPDALDAITYPPPRDGAPPGTVREIELAVTERRLEVGDGVFVDAWVYGGTAPGPIIRATEGDLVRIRFRNLTSRPHNLHFHGAHSPSMDGWEPIPGGGEFVYEIEAGPAGVHPYHCHVMPLAMHVARGLYGTLIVDPVEPRSPAMEVVLLLSGWDPEEYGTNYVYAWNGVAGFYDRHPIRVRVGEPVRAYVLNMTEYEPVGSFHLHARTFDVYPSGMGEEPAYHGDVVTLGQGERAMLEFTLPERGRYMFHPHQHHIAGAGAMGWFSAI